MIPLTTSSWLSSLPLLRIALFFSSCLPPLLPLYFNRFSLPSLCLASVAFPSSSAFPCLQHVLSPLHLMLPLSSSHFLIPPFPSFVLSLLSLAQTSSFLFILSLPSSSLNFPLPLLTLASSVDLSEHTTLAALLPRKYSAWRCFFLYASSFLPRREVVSQLTLILTGSRTFLPYVNSQRKNNDAEKFVRVREGTRKRTHT